MTFDDYCKATGHYAEDGDLAMWEAATKAEREACAIVCENIDDRCAECAAHNDHEQCLVPEKEQYADAIRKRSNARN